MTVFPTVGHFASWAGAGPGHHHQSAGRRSSGRNRPDPGWLTSQLTECDFAEVRTKGIYLACHHAQLRGSRGEQKAIGAIRHDPLGAATTSSATRSPTKTLAQTDNASATRSSIALAAHNAQLEAFGYAVTFDKVERQNKPPELTNKQTVHHQANTDPA